MKGIDIIDALNELDEELVQDAKRQGKTVPKWLKYSSLAACLCCLVGAAGIWLGTILSPPTEAPSTAAAAEQPISPQESLIIKSQPDTWEPWYSGEDRDWDHAEPWAFDPGEEEPRETEQSEGMEAFNDIQQNREDFGGCYINCSGTLTVLITDPTEETAAEYAAMTDVGIWIVEAEYTLKELQETYEGLHEDVDRWLKAHPDSNLILNSSGIVDYHNRIVLHLSGTSIDYLTDNYPMPDCVSYVLYSTEDASSWTAAPREPQTVWQSEHYDVSVSMAQAEYPYGTETVTLVLENDTEGLLGYGYSYSMEKYINGNWVNVSGNLAFNAVGLSVEEYSAETMTISTEQYPSELGIGLYRIIGTDLSYSPRNGYGLWEDLGQYVVEFCITDIAPEPTEVVAENTWLPLGEIIPSDQIQVYLWGPYVAGLDYDMENAVADQPQEMTVTVYDRRTGEAVNHEPFVFEANYPDSLSVDHAEELFYIQTESGTYAITVMDGEAVMIADVTFPDETFPFAPETVYTAMDGDFVVEADQDYFFIDDGKVTFTITNNTDFDLTSEKGLNIRSFNQIFTWGWESRFLRYSGDISETLPTEVESTPFSIESHSSVIVEVDLSLWGTPSETTDEFESLVSGLYRIVYDDLQFTDQYGDLHPLSFMVEFMLDYKK